MDDLEAAIKSASTDDLILGLLALMRENETEEPAECHLLLVFTVGTELLRRDVDALGLMVSAKTLQVPE